MKKKLSILAGAAVLATSLTPLANVSAWTVSPAAGSAVTLRREINNVATVVTNTFTYTITPGASNPGTVTGLPATTTIVFNNANPSGGKVAGSVDLSFASAVFSALGDYTFVITETGSTDAVNYPTSTDSYTAYVSVRNELSGGVPTGNHVAVLGWVSETTSGDKLTTFTGNNSEALFDGGVVRTYVSVSKSVTGNAAEIDQCFELKVNFTGVVGVNFDFESETTCTGNPASVSGNGATSIYLKHGDVAYLGGNGSSIASEIPIGVEWSVVEQGASDYETYIDGSTTNSKTSATKTTALATSANFDSTNRIAVVNNKESAPNTGVVLSILPFVIIAMIGIFGAAYVAKTKKVTE